MNFVLGILMQVVVKASRSVYCMVDTGFPLCLFPASFSSFRSVHQITPLLAETGGLEPPDDFYTVCNLAGCLFHQLTHVSSCRRTCTSRHTHRAGTSRYWLPELGLNQQYKSQSLMCYQLHHPVLRPVFINERGKASIIGFVYQIKLIIEFRNSVHHAKQRFCICALSAIKINDQEGIFFGLHLPNKFFNVG